MQDDIREQFHLLHEAMEMTNKAVEELHAAFKDAREAKGDVHQTIADAKSDVHKTLADAKAALDRAKENLKKHV
jgi:F0F1-type ATP synthase membrane subunit b/b'